MLVVVVWALGCYAEPIEPLAACIDGMCLAGLVCSEGLCRMPGDDSSSQGSNASSLATDDGMSTTIATGFEDTTAADSSASDPTIATASPTESSSGSDPTAESESAASTGGEMTAGSDEMGSTGTPVDGAACHACLIDSNGAGAACEMSFIPCSYNSECVALASCVAECLDADDPPCVAGCCTAHPAGLTEYGDLAGCHDGQCAMDCTGFSLGCGG